MNLNLFQTNKITHDAITTIGNYEHIKGYSVETTWSAITNEGKPRKHPIWTISIRPTFGGGQSRRIAGTGTVQYMNQVKDNVMNSLEGPVPNEAEPVLAFQA